MKISLYTNKDAFAEEFLDVAKLFFPNTEAEILQDSALADICVFVEENGNTVTSKCTFRNQTETNGIVIDRTWSNLEIKRFCKRYAKLAVYNCLKKSLNKSMPWGSLTGIRPTKLAYEIQNNENADFGEVFSQLLDVSPAKISLVEDILRQQQGLRTIDDNKVDVYVGIPFCTSRCSYCSFTSGEISKLAKYVQPFVDCLKEEIASTLTSIKQYGYTVENVYFGGGTPTSLSTTQLDEILSLFGGLSGEFTVESGRPDTIDEEKLQVMQRCGVNRISINPQSFCQKTLDLIGRKHSVKDIIDKFTLARQFDFVINMDLIAGLPQEDLQTFKNTLDKTISLAPDNITVHTLALKRGSKLRENDENTEAEDKVCAMIDYSREKLYNATYRPYYLYRQKYVSANLENVGYCLANKQCKYNIDIMEETTSIVACGCNAISKRVFGAENRIERQANPKDVKTYIERIEDFLAKKRKLFER